jgi:hypothetical protein
VRENASLTLTALKQDVPTLQPRSTLISIKPFDLNSCDQRLDCQKCVSGPMPGASGRVMRI